MKYRINRITVYTIYILRYILICRRRRIRRSLKQCSSCSADAADTDARRATALSLHLISYHGLADHTTTPRPPPTDYDQWRAFASCACARVHDCCLAATVLPCVRVRVTFVSVCARSSVFLAPA